MFVDNQLGGLFHRSANCRERFYLEARIPEMASYSVQLKSNARFFLYRSQFFSSSLRQVHSDNKKSSMRISVQLKGFLNRC